jgi:hypothetical protein
MVQLAPAARVVPQVLANTKDDASAPVNLMLVIGTAAPEELVTVTDFDRLASPTVVEAKARLLAERLNKGATPVPFNVMVCGELLALSVMAMAAVSRPREAGAKCP